MLKAQNLDWEQKMNDREKAYWIYSFFKILVISLFATAIYIAIIYHDKL